MKKIKVEKQRWVEGDFMGVSKDHLSGEVTAKQKPLISHMQILKETF